YHDRSDGGLFTTLCEMAFASHCGLKIDLSSYVNDFATEGMAALFNEESGVVIQVSKNKKDTVKTLFQSKNNIAVHDIATISSEPEIKIICQDLEHFSAPRKTLHASWSKTSFMLQRLRDNPLLAEQAYHRILHNTDPGLMVKCDFVEPTPPAILKGIKPKVAILREQGVNGQLEMAAAFTLAGFEAVDVTMSDLLAGKSLASFQVLAACGGFSYGDVLGAGKGWAKTILYQTRLREEFSAFFQRNDTLTLGICNGCQMLSALKDLIPGAASWPQFVRNTSEQFEARLSLVEVCQSPSHFLQNMAGAILPIPVAHGEGCVTWDQNPNGALVALRYVDNHGKPTENYPENPNGSEKGMTGFTTPDGRVTIMMPHPERVFKSWQLSWHPPAWQGNSPWMQLFINARLGLK
ncbi:MAG: phosphoribosylformylglycinamidine synthase subunit PurQ, partial [Candidatus Berkiellales bacterium]